MKEILRSLRTAHNYSQSAVASYLNISRQMYNKYENGSAEPSLKNIKKLCDLYKIPADVFLRSELDIEEKFSKSDLYSFNYDSELHIASPSVVYSPSKYFETKENSEEGKQIRKSGLATIREMLKNDEW